MKDPEVPKILCAKEGCNKKIHLLCCQELALKPLQAKDQNEGNLTNLLEESQVACKPAKAP